MVRQNDERPVDGLSRILILEPLIRLHMWPGRLIMAIVVALTAANIIGMAILAYFSKISGIEAFILAIALVIALQMPILLLLVFRPLARQNAERQHAVDELWDSEEKFRIFFENSIDGMLISRPDGTILRANAAACRVLGMTEEEIRHAGRDGILDTSDPRLAEIIEERNRTGEVQGEVNCRRKDGTVLPIELSSAAFVDRHGTKMSSLIFRDISERKKVENELISSRKQLRALMTHLLTAREEERGRISREIHDELGQTLATVQMGVSLLAEDYHDHHRLTARIHDFDLLLMGAIKTVQRIAAELRPRMLDLLGLAEAVEWQAKEFEKHTGITCKSVILLQREDFSPDVATAVFRIFQEALTNVMRHSGASRVDVTLEERLGSLALIIRDDGRGIRRDELDNSNSLGIMGMKERAFALGGRVRVLNSHRQGTVVVARIPVKQTGDA